MKTIKDALVIAWINGWIAATRGWIWVVASSVSPLSFLVLLAIYGGVEGLLWGVLGSLVWTIASNGISLMPNTRPHIRTAELYQRRLREGASLPIIYRLHMFGQKMLWSRCPFKWKERSLSTALMSIWASPFLNFSSFSRAAFAPLT